MNTNVGVIHTTEGTGWPSYDGGASAPTITAKPDFKAKKLHYRQHFPVDKSARALVNARGGTEVVQTGSDDSERMFVRHRDASHLSKRPDARASTPTRSPARTPAQADVLPATAPRHVR